MAEYLIPNYKMSELEKKINRIRNKGAQITFNIIEENVPVDAPELGAHVRILCTRVEVEGTYIINGWRFVATIEHASPENIIRLADTSMSGRIPERYRTAAKECEHCHINRDRHDTYLVYNEEQNEWKQVGKTCLQSYTNGLNAETCAGFASVMSEIARIANETNDHHFDSNELSDIAHRDWMHSYSDYPMEYIRKVAYSYVVANGYTSGITGKAFNDALENGYNTEASDEDINAVTNWLNNIANNSDWVRNARAVWNKATFENRDAGLLTSIISVYLKNREQEAQRTATLNNAANTYAGEMGDKVTFTVSTVRIAYYRDSGSYYGGSYPVYKMVGTDGRVYMWGSASGVEPTTGDTLTGTIKKTYESRTGERTTEVTRCKIIHPTETTVEEQPQHQIPSIFSFHENLNEDYKSHNYLDEFYNYCSYFVDTIDDLVAILKSKKIIAKKDKNEKIIKGICFTGGTDLYRIAKRYEKKKNYKYGIIFNLDLLRSIKKRLPHNIKFVNEFVDQLPNTDGYRITGIYKLNESGLFILKPYIFNFSTPVLIDNQDLYDRLKQRLDEMIDLYPKAYGELITKDENNIGEDVKQLAEEGNYKIIETYTFIANNSKLAFTADKTKDNWDYEKIKNFLNTKESGTMRELGTEIGDLNDQISRSYGIERSNLENERAEKEKELNQLYYNRYNKKWGIRNKREYQDFKREIDLDGRARANLSIPLQFIYINVKDTDQNSDIDSLAYSDLDEQEIRVVNMPELAFVPSDIAWIVIQTKSDLDNPELKLLLDNDYKNVLVEPLHEENKKEGN